jgi:serine/threonine protein phosphatase 1
MFTIHKSNTDLHVVPAKGLALDDHFVLELEALVEQLDRLHLLRPGCHSFDDIIDLLTRNNRRDSLSQTISSLCEARNKHLPTDEIPHFVAHERNLVGKDYVVGDIHGQLDAFNHALKAVGFNQQVDRCFSVGDLIDRGKDSLACLELVFEDWFFATLGNHEAMAITALGPSPSDNDLAHWIDNGADWLLSENAKEVSILMREAARYLPLAREVDLGNYRVGICHAEPPENWEWVRHSAQAHSEKLTWGRTRFKYGLDSNVSGIDAVVVGHSIMNNVTRLGNVVNIDTGAFTTTGKLTLLPLTHIAAF